MRSASRVVATLNFVLNHVEQVNGFFYHFIDINTGQRVRQSEVSPIDTTILLCGILTAREYFHDPEISQLATTIYKRINWRWMLNGGQTFALGWTPEYKFIGSRWDTYCELMMMYLLAIGAPAYNISPSSWNAFSRPIMEFEDYSYISGPDPLFVHQYSHAWFDFRNQRDQYANYFRTPRLRPRLTGNSAIRFAGVSRITTKTPGASPPPIRTWVIRTGEVRRRSATSMARWFPAPPAGQSPSGRRKPSLASPISTTNMAWGFGSAMDLSMLSIRAPAGPMSM